MTLNNNIYFSIKQIIFLSINLIQNIRLVQLSHAQTKDHNYELPTSEIESPLTSPKIVERTVKVDKNIELKTIKLQKDLI